MPDLVHIVKELRVVAEEAAVHKIMALDAGKSQGKFVAIGLGEKWPHSKHVYYAHAGIEVRSRSIQIWHIN